MRLQYFLIPHVSFFALFHVCTSFIIYLLLTITTINNNQFYYNKMN
ncbi:334R [Invertebrate iridescent virus Kaz2018]|nr:334R [Invertebrate iridescent virus Kaz2018]